MASDVFLNYFLSRHDRGKHLIASANNNFGLKSQANRKRLWISLVKQNSSSSSGSFHPRVKEHCRFKASVFVCENISFFVKISGMLKFKAFTILTALYSPNVFATDLPPVCEVVLTLSRQEFFFLTWYSNCRLINFNVGMEFVSHSRTGETLIMELL